MLISSLEELRLFSPSNAIDNIESLMGFLSSSEHDFLEEKLGVPLHKSLCDYYVSSVKSDPMGYVAQLASGEDIPPYARLLYVAQKCLTFDALSRAVSVQAISMNGSGINVASADDYKPADANIIAEYKKACIKEAHSAVNELLVLLERWTTDNEETSEEAKEIAGLWKHSRYYYLAASMLIPSASVLQEYYNIYDSREKFINLLPDIRYIQEDVLEPIFGEEIITKAVDTARNITPDLQDAKALHYLRKIVARHLEARCLKPNDPRGNTAYNEAIKLTERLQKALQKVKEEDNADNGVNHPVAEHINKCDEDNGSSVIFVTPGLV